jgi:putative endonuclease
MPGMHSRAATFATAQSVLNGPNSPCIVVITEPRMERASYVYILASGLNGTLYIGVTSDLVKRVWQHREGFIDGFTKRYGVKQLVWYEVHGDIVEAIRREKQIKKWERAWKVELIQKTNPHWRDLYPEIIA